MRGMRQHQLGGGQISEFATGGVSGMMGAVNSVISQLRDSSLVILNFKCVSHNFHICEGEASETVM